MTDDKDLLLQQFFSEAAQQQIADDGFTERVMQHLPQDAPETTALQTPVSPVTAQASVVTLRRVNRLWTVACIAVFAALFVVFRGWELLAVQLEVLVRTLSVTTFTIKPMTLLVVGFGLLCAGASELLVSQRRWF